MKKYEYKHVYGLSDNPLDITFDYIIAIGEGVNKGIKSALTGLHHPIDNILIPTAELLSDVYLEISNKTELNPTVAITYGLLPGKYFLNNDPLLEHQSRARNHYRIEGVKELWEDFASANNPKKVEMAVSGLTDWIVNGAAIGGVVKAGKMAKSLSKIGTTNATLYQSRFRKDFISFPEFEYLNLKAVKESGYTGNLLYAVTEDYEFLLANEALKKPYQFIRKGSEDISQYMVLKHDILAKFKKVFAAGELTFEKGIITAFNNDSGHFLPFKSKIGKIVRKVVAKNGGEEIFYATASILKKDRAIIFKPSSQILKSLPYGGSLMAGRESSSSFFEYPDYDCSESNITEKELWYHMGYTSMLDGETFDAVYDPNSPNQPKYIEVSMLDQINDMHNIKFTKSYQSHDHNASSREGKFQAINAEDDNYACLKEYYEQIERKVTIEGFDDARELHNHMMLKELLERREQKLQKEKEVKENIEHTIAEQSIDIEPHLLDRFAKQVKPNQDNISSKKPSTFATYKAIKKIQSEFPDLTKLKTAQVKEIKSTFKKELGKSVSDEAVIDNLKNGYFGYVNRQVKEMMGYQPVRNDQTNQDIRQIQDVLQKMREEQIYAQKIQDISNFGSYSAALASMFGKDKLAGKIMSHTNNALMIGTNLNRIAPNMLANMGELGAGLGAAGGMISQTISAFVPYLGVAVGIASMLGLGRRKSKENGMQKFMEAIIQQFHHIVHADGERTRHAIFELGHKMQLWNMALMEASHKNYIATLENKRDIALFRQEASELFSQISDNLIKVQENIQNNADKSLEQFNQLLNAILETDLHASLKKELETIIGRLKEARNSNGQSEADFNADITTLKRLGTTYATSSPHTGGNVNLNPNAMHAALTQAKDSSYIVNLLKNLLKVNTPDLPNPRYITEVIKVACYTLKLQMNSSQADPQDIKNNVESLRQIAKNARSIIEFEDRIKNPDIIKNQLENYKANLLKFKEFVEAKIKQEDARLTTERQRDLQKMFDESAKTLSMESYPKYDEILKEVGTFEQNVRQDFANLYNSYDKGL